MSTAAPHLRLVVATADEPEAPGAPTGEAARHATSPVEEPAAGSGVEERQASLCLDRLFAEHSRFVAAVVLRVLGRDHEVDDVVQEVFLDALVGVPKVRTPAAIRGWLKTVAVRKAYRHLRKRRVRAFFGLDHPSCYEHLPATGCGPEERALLSRVYHMLDQISVSERLAWTLRYVEGEQVEAVAALCGCSLATVKRRIAAASAALERMLGHV